MPADPVLVLGCGPVGQSAALLLDRWGLPSVVMDGRAHRDRVGSKSICQQRDVLDIWDFAGPGREIAERGVTWTTARTFHGDRELFCISFADRGRSPFPPFVNISQSETEELLDRALAERPGIEVRWDHEVVDIDQDDHGVTATCANGEQVTGSHLIACPGAHGDRIRDLLDVRFDGHAFADQFLICDIRTELPGWENERRFYFDPVWNPGRQVLIHPCPDSTYRIDWQVPPEFDLAAEEANGGLDRRIRQIVGDRPYEIVWRSVYRFQSRIADRLRVGRVLLAGDAAHLFSPFGARGLNSGVCDVENAAWKIAFVRRGWGGDALLDSYSAERHPAAVENLEITSATMRFLVPGTDADRQQRVDVLRRAASDPDARRLVDSGRLCEPFWYVDSPVVVPDPARPFAGRPDRGDVPAPAPGVLVPDCPVSGPAGIVRLRQLARRGGLTVLLGDGAAEPAPPAGFAADVTVHRMHDLDADLSAMLGAGPDELWLLRPDAYVAAVVSDEAALHAAMRRAVAAPVLVVAAAIVRADMVLAAHRPGRGWEFPGGKVEARETVAAGLVRECREELAVAVEPLRELGTAIDDGIELRLWHARLVGDAPDSSTDHDELRWLGAADLESVAWLPVDQKLLDVVRPLVARIGSD
jgi:3-(3-hydroxy-phenyl)propionate hydroxylase